MSTRSQPWHHGQQEPRGVRARQADPSDPAPSLLETTRGVCRGPPRMGPRFPLFIPSLYVRPLRLTPMLHPTPTLLAGGLLSLQATSTGKLNTILTLYEIANPPASSVLSGIPESLLRNAIGILAQSSRARLISISDGDGPGCTALPAQCQVTTC